MDEIEPVGSVSDSSDVEAPAPSPAPSAPAATDAPSPPTDTTDTVSRSDEADEPGDSHGEAVTRGMRDLRDGEREAAGEGNTPAAQAAQASGNSGNSDNDVTRKIAAPSKNANPGPTVPSSRDGANANSPALGPQDKSQAGEIQKIMSDKEQPVSMEYNDSNSPYNGWELGGDRNNWGFGPSPDKLEAGVKDALQGEQPTPGSNSLKLPNGQTATFERTQGSGGVDQYAVKLPDGRNMNVFMNNTGLDDKGVNTALTNISDTVHRAPNSLYARQTEQGLDRNNTLDVYVDRSLGFGGTRNGTGAVNGLTDPDRLNSLHVAAPFTQNPEHLRAVMDHEAGHLLDYRNGNVSDRGLWGSAIPGKTGSFVSDYAGSTRKEDFAETNAELMRFRYAYRDSTGRDFLKATPAEQTAALTRPWNFNANGVSQRVQYDPVVYTKMRQIADIYRNLGN